MTIFGQEAREWEDILIVSAGELKDTQGSALSITKQPSSNTNPASSSV